MITSIAIGLVVGAVWGVSSLLSYRLILNHFQSKYPRIAKETYHNDVGFARMWSVLGPLGLLWGFFFSGGYPYGFPKKGE